MIKLKKILLILTFFSFFSSCGYTPIFSKKEVNFNIENIKYLGDRTVSAKIDNTLSSYKNKINKKNKISLVIESLKNTIVASRDSKGEAQTKKIIINSNIKIILSKNKFSEKKFSRSSIYSVVKRKSEQKLVENKLIENLSNDIAMQIIFEILKKINN